MPSRRPERVSGLLLETVADILLREVKDPRVSGVILTTASISPDLGEARIFFRTLGSPPHHPDRTEVEAGLKSASAYIRRQIAGRLQLRRIPQLRFLYDTSIDQANHMESLFQQARTKSTTQTASASQEKKPPCPE
jgi:ribosome-binding factor A